MTGETGRDTCKLDNQGDVVIEGTGGGVDTVQTTLGNLTLVAEVERVVAPGTADFRGTGNILTNTIIGNIGNDRIAGLDGGDTMTGGFGDDVSVFDRALTATNRDTIRTSNLAMTRSGWKPSAPGCSTRCQLARWRRQPSR